MNKTQLIEAVAKSTKIPKTQVGQVLDGLTATITKALKKKDEKVTLVGFGTFETSRRKARTGRNPRTGAEIKIPARRVVRFRPGKALRDTIK